MCVCAWQYFAQKLNCGVSRIPPKQRGNMNKIIENILSLLRANKAEIDSANLINGKYTIESFNSWEGRWEEFLILKLSKGSKEMLNYKYQIDSESNTEKLWTQDEIEKDFYEKTKFYLQNERSLCDGDNE
jgi:hypothetical protein